MYAIIKDGGHRYRVEMGQRIRVQKRDVEAGGVITFKEVCLLSTKDDEAMIGTPFVTGASVEAKVLAPEVKARKVIVLKIAGGNWQRRNCRRQKFTEIEITGIQG